MIAGDLNTKIYAPDKLTGCFSVSYIYPPKTFLCSSKLILETTDLKDLVTVLKEQLKMCFLSSLATFPQTVQWMGPALGFWYYRWGNKYFCWDQGATLGSLGRHVGPPVTWCGGVWLYRLGLDPENWDLEFILIIQRFLWFDFVFKWTLFLAVNCFLTFE